MFCSRQQEIGKSGGAGSGSQGTSSSPVPQTSGMLTVGQPPSSAGVGVGSSLLAEVKEECKTPNIGSFNAACLTPGASAFGLGVSIDKDEPKVFMSAFVFYFISISAAAVFNAVLFEYCKISFKSINEKFLLDLCEASCNIKIERLGSYIYLLAARLIFF